MEIRGDHMRFRKPNPIGHMQDQNPSTVLALFILLGNVNGLFSIFGSSGITSLTVLFTFKLMLILLFKFEYNSLNLFGKNFYIEAFYLRKAVSFLLRKLNFLQCS